MKFVPFRASFASRKTQPLQLLVLTMVAYCLLARPLPAQTITYVQGNYAAPQTSQATVNVTYTAAQTAGDLNVVVVGWNDSTNTVSSVRDTLGNTYQLAVGPTVVSGYLSQSVYFAKNIFSAAAGANTVTVQFSGSAAYPDIRILEYRGADLANPVDVTKAATGNSTSSNSGTVTTTNATDLLFGANIVTSATTGPGASFTQRMLTVPDGDIAEDRMVTAVGSYSAVAPITRGRWIMQLVAFRTPLSGGDTQPPTAPTNLAATAASGTQLNLSWTASTDNVGVTGYLVERCQGASCSNFAQVGTATGTTYNDTGLTNATSYNYRVRATDAAGNLSTYSNTANGTTLDTQAPTAPASLAATAASGTQINLSWTASTDNVGVTGYLVERCQGASCSSFAQIGTATGTTYNDTGLTNATSYRYRVRATDAAGNLSAYSNIASGTTLDTQAPTAPGSLNATAAGGSQINLTWVASTDNVGVTGYLVERCQGASCSNFAQVGTSGGAAFSDTGLTANTSYSYRVRATDSAGNLSTYSNTASATTQNPDTQPPTAPSSLTATAAGGTQINLAWTASTDDVGVTNYLIERCQGASCTTFAQIATATGTTFNDTTVTNATSYNYRVRATDAAGNLSGYSNTASATTPDTQAPTAPSALTATAAGATQINLSWSASTDNVGVTNYLIERCQGASCSSFSQVATATSTNFSDTGLTNGTSYSYRVRATDAASNLSAYSNTATATTPDTQAPTAPSTLTASSVSASQINLSWTASTDNVGVTNYLVERCQGTGCSNFAQIATSTTTTYNNTGLSAGTTYLYRVRAADAAGNLSGYSNVASATTSASNPVITYVQSNSADPQSPQSTVAVKFNSAQTAGNLNVVAVGWNDTTRTVSSVTDTSGNTYVRAVGPTAVSGTLSQSIYYAKNILAAAAGANTVTVTFSAAASYPDIRILEYSGADLATPVDVTSAATGTSGTFNSGSVTTTNATDLLFGANMTTGSTTAPGSGFTQRVLTVPDSDIAEDRMVTSVGSYSATATGSGQWIMQLVAFRTPIGPPDTQPPTAPTNLNATAPSGTQINLSWNASTDNVAVSGYLIERCQGTSCSNFAQVGTSTTTSFSDSGLTPSTPYSYQVRASDAAGNLSPYSNIASTTTQAADTQPPTQPANLTATAISGNQINLSWTASTDNIGVTGYLIERCQGTGCTNFGRLFTVTGTTYSDTGLVPNTSYTYQVKATDAAGNFSPYSNTATASTLSVVTGLVAAYSFDEGSGTTVTDLSGNNNNGTVSNTTWTGAAKYGNALVFNGSSSRVNINDSDTLKLTTAMTLEAWVNPSIVDGVWRDVIYKGNDNYYLEATSIAGPPAGGGTFGSTSNQSYGLGPIPASSWTHLAVTYDGSAIRLYINAVQVSSKVQTGNIATSTNPLQIGGDSIFGQYFAGTIDEVRVYNVALNQSQIQSDMITPLGGGGSLPLVSLSTTSLSFGNVATGSTGSPQPVTLTNIGGAALAISSIAVSGANSGDFGQTNNCGSAVAAGASCTINVTFSPTTTGNRISSVVITDNAPGSPQTISLSGTGTGFAVTPRVATLTFTQTQQFSATGSVTWSVDGVVGGNAAVGTITPTGLYTPPSSVGTHTITATGTQTASATVYITSYPGTFTYHNDNLRSGVNGSEWILTPANVNQAQFGRLGSHAIDGWAYASPLYVANVNIPGQGYHNVVYVATEHDSVYAFDADSLGSAPLWQVSFLSSGVTTVPCADVGECGDVPVEIGITGTPVIDQSTGTLYVVAKTKEPGTKYVQRLHALDIATGAEKFGGPVVIQGSVTGNGAGSSGGTLAFDPLRELQRPGLLLSGGVVYIGFAAHGDQPPWHGWIMGYNASTLQRTVIWCSSPNGYGGGIWQSGAAMATDASGNMYFTTGNGDFNVNTGGINYGDSVVKLSPGGSVVDYFTPYDQAVMESQNIELSSAGPVLLIDQPGSHPHRLVTAAKTGTIYVVDRDNMGHFQSGSDSQILQSLPGVLPHGGQEEGNYSAPVFFNNNIYYAAVRDNLKIFQFNGGVLSSSPVSQSTVTYPNRGGSFAVSANATANGLLWAVQDNTPAGGTFRVYDANNLANELYNSDQAGSRDTLGFATKFSIPLIANGKVFVVSSTEIVSYGLLP